MRQNRRQYRNGNSNSSGDSERPSNPSSAVRIPHDPINESVVLAATIVDEGTRKRYLATLEPAMFFGTGHALIWATLQELYRKGLNYDPATMRQIGGPDLDITYLEDLLNQRPALPPNLNHHIEMLVWDFARVSTAKGAVTRFLELLKDPKTDPVALRSASEEITAGLATGSNRSLRNPKQLVAEQMKIIYSRLEGIACYGFGIPGLDLYGKGDTKLDADGRIVDLAGTPRLIPGTFPGQITCVTGLSGSGKTSVTARGVLGMFNAGRRITYGAFEQGSGMTLELLAAFSLGMSRSDLMTGRFTSQDAEELREAMARIGERVLFDEMPYERFSNRQKFPNDRAIDRIVQSIIDSDCEVYVADLFRRVLTETDPDAEDHALIQIQQAAKKTGCHIILVQQQKSKEVEASKSKLPRRDTIKGVSTWVDISDEILGFHRPALWKNVPDDKIFSLVLKQRFGPFPMMVEHDWNSEFASVEGGRTVEMQREGDESAENLDLFNEPLLPTSKRGF